MEPYSSSLMATHGDLAAGVVTKPQARERRRTPRHRRSTLVSAAPRRLRWQDSLATETASCGFGYLRQWSARRRLASGCLTQR
jgi:hypothetical protein